VKNWPIGRLLKRRNGGGFVIKGGEEIQQADHFQGLQGKFGGFQEADGAAGLLGGGEMADQHANTAGIDSGDSFEIEDDPGMAMAEEFDNRGVEAIERGAHAEASGEFDDFDSAQSFRINIQRRHPFETVGSPWPG
jgi:hypothetical protein